MRRGALLLVTAAALILPQAALGHASLSRSSPGFGERVERAPRAIVLAFDQGVRGFPNSVRVFRSDGRVVSAAPRRRAGRVIEVPLARLGRGAYTVRWQAISAVDGHVISGVYTFGVRVAAPPPTEAYGAAGPSRAEHVVRWAYFVALSLLLGGLGFRLLVLRGPLPERVERRFYAVSAVGAVAALEVGVVAFLLRAEGALQLPFGRLLYGDLSPIAGGTRFGTAFIAMTLGFAGVAALLFLAWLTDVRALLWAALAVGLGFASGLSLSGHAADPGSPRTAQLADWVHLSAAALWVGGLVQLSIVVWPAAPELRRRAFLGFARLAPVLIALLVAAGTYLSIVRLPRASDLWTETYGHVLLVKLALVAVALAWGAAHHFLVRPLLDRGDDRRHLRTSLAGESAIGMAILLVAAVLVNSEPPRPTVPQPAEARPASIQAR
ncbi:MAG: copper resistance protein CopC/CopD [Actinobacteria bacterium]|nr:copper resistance protein CopC/CopD [Actinomycetota bacterium]